MLDTSDVDVSELTPLDTESAALMETGTSYISWWDNILSAEDSETYKDLLAQLMAMKITPEEFCESMSKLMPIRILFQINVYKRTTFICSPFSLRLDMLRSGNAENIIK